MMMMTSMREANVKRKLKLPPEPHRGCKTLPCTSLFNFPVTFAHFIGESRIFQRIVIFFIIARYKYSYLLTY